MSSEQEKKHYCIECGWSGTKQQMERKMWCYLCPKCRIVILYEGGQIKLSAKRVLAPGEETPAEELPPTAQATPAKCQSIFRWVGNETTAGYPCGLPHGHSGKHECSSVLGAPIRW